MGPCGAEKFHLPALCLPFGLFVVLFIEPYCHFGGRISSSTMFYLALDFYIQLWRYVFIQLDFYILDLFAWHSSRGPDLQQHDVSFGFGFLYPTLEICFHSTGLLRPGSLCVAFIHHRGKSVNRFVRVCCTCISLSFVLQFPGRHSYFTFSAFWFLGCTLVSLVPARLFEKGNSSTLHPTSPWI